MSIPGATIHKPRPPRKDNGLHEFSHSPDGFSHYRLWQHFSKAQLEAARKLYYSTTKFLHPGHNYIESSSRL